MITIEFKDGNLEKLYNNSLNAKHPKIRLKNFALYLKCKELPHSQICDICRISEPTLAKYLKYFKEGGFARLEELKWNGQQSELNAYTDLIDRDFEQNPPRTINEALCRIEKLTGLKRSPTQIQYFLKNKLKLKYLKMGSIPGNGKDDDVEKEMEREDFKKKLLIHYWIKPEKERL